MDNITSGVIIVAVIIWLLKNIVWDWLMSLKNGRKESTSVNMNGSINLDPGLKKAIYNIEAKVNNSHDLTKDVERKLEDIVKESTKQTLLLEQIASKK